MSLRVAQRGIGQQAFGKEQLGGGGVDIDAFMIVRPQSADEGFLVRLFELGADRDLRQPGILSVHGVSGEAQLGAPDVLFELEAFPETERGAGFACVENHLRIRDFEPVMEADGAAKTGDVEILERHITVMGRGPDSAIRFIARDERPGRQRAAACPFEVGNAAGQQQLATGLLRNDLSYADWRKCYSRTGSGEEDFLTHKEVSFWHWVNRLPGAAHPKCGY
ncbi:MAG: hypothetical protein RLO80_11865 [Hyphomonas sp.]